MSILTDAFSSYGSYIGNTGKIMTFLSDKKIPALPIFAALIIVSLYLIIRDYQKSGLSGIFFPLGIILVLINFVVSPTLALLIIIITFVLIGVHILLQVKDPNTSQLAVFWQLGLLVGISYLVFGSTYMLFVASIIGILGFLVIKHSLSVGEKGSRGERSLAGREGYDIRPEEKILKKEHWIRRLAKKVKGKLRGLGKATGDEAQIEQSNVETEIHAAALAAGVKEISNTLTDMDKAELTAEQRDMKVLEAAKVIDKHIKEHALVNAEDTQKTAMLKADAKKLVDVIGEIVKDEKYADKYREHSVKAIKKTEDIIKNSAVYAKKILASEIRLEKNIGRDINSAIKELTKALTEKSRQLEDLANRSKSNPQMREQLGSLEQERDFLNKSLSEVNNVRSKVYAELKKGVNALRVMKADAQAIVDAEKNLVEFSENMKKLEDHITKNVKEMDDQFSKFQKEINSLDKDALPEEVNLKATYNVGVIFKDLKRFIQDTIDFNKNEILPFITKNGEVLQRSFSIENAADYGNKVSRLMTDALKHLAEMANAANGGNSQAVNDAKSLIQIDKFQENVSNVADWKENKIKSDVKQSYGDLGEAVKSVNAQISYLENEKKEVDDVEKKTIDDLNTAMKELTELRKKQFQNFRSAAEKAEADLAKAKRFERKEKAAA